MNQNAPGNCHLMRVIELLTHLLELILIVDRSSLLSRLKRLRPFADIVLIKRENGSAKMLKSWGMQFGWCPHFVDVSLAIHPIILSSRSEYYKVFQILVENIISWINDFFLDFIFVYLKEFYFIYISKAYNLSPSWCSQTVLESMWFDWRPRIMKTNCWNIPWI